MVRNWSFNLAIAWLLIHSCFSDRTSVIWAGALLPWAFLALSAVQLNVCASNRVDLVQLVFSFTLFQAGIILVIKLFTFEAEEELERIYTNRHVVLAKVSHDIRYALSLQKYSKQKPKI
jgi:hypothetical protein